MKSLLPKALCQATSRSVENGLKAGTNTWKKTRLQCMALDKIMYSPLCSIFYMVFFFSPFFFMFYQQFWRTSSVFCLSGWCRSDGAEDHCRHLWGLGSPWWWCLLRQRLFQGGSLCSLRSSLGGQVSCQGWSVQTCACPGELCLKCDAFATCILSSTLCYLGNVWPSLAPEGAQF